MLTLHRAWAIGTDGRCARVGDRSLRFEGQNAFVEILRRIVGGSRPVPSDYRQELPYVMDQLVGRSLEIAPEDRFSSVAALREALFDVTTSQYPALVVSAQPMPDPSLPRLPVVAAKPVSETGLISEYTYPELGAEEVAATSLLPAPMMGMSTTITPLTSGRRWPSWVEHIGPVVLGTLLGALGYHLMFGPTSRPPAREVLESNVPPARSVRGPSATVRVDPTTIQAPPPTRGPARPDSTDKAAAQSPGTSSRAKPRPSRRRRASEETPSSDRYASLKKALAQLRAQADVERLDALIRAIRRAARRLKDKKVAARIDRLAVASMITGDLDGLEQCLELLSSAR